MIINAIIVNIPLIKIKNRWKYSVKQYLYDGNIDFVLKGSHEKNMLALNSSSIQFHVSIITMYISLVGEELIEIK